MSILAIEFNPIVYTVTVNNCSYELLTLDGETPQNTVYFLKKGTGIPSNHVDAVNKIIESGEYEESTSINQSDVNEYDIDLSVFYASGEDYEVKK